MTVHPRCGIQSRRHTQFVQDVRHMMGKRSSSEVSTTNEVACQSGRVLLLGAEARRALHCQADRRHRMGGILILKYLC